jgi:hypothetical protein
VLKQTKKRPPLDRAAAETIAAQGLAFLAANPSHLSRFLAVTGLDPGHLRARLGSPEVLAAALGYLLSDESLLLVFSDHTGVAAETIAPALALLEGAVDP